jgi:hypothetical protein
LQAKKMLSGILVFIVKWKVCVRISASVTAVLGYISINLSK